MFCKNNDVVFSLDRMFVTLRYSNCTWMFRCQVVGMFCGTHIEDDKHYATIAESRRQGAESRREEAESRREGLAVGEETPHAKSGVAFAPSSLSSQGPRQCVCVVLQWRND